MKIFISLLFLAISLNSFVIPAKILKCESTCGEDKEWALGPTWECDSRICRGIPPICEDPPQQVWRCFCKDGKSLDGDRCTSECPLYP